MENFEITALQKGERREVAELLASSFSYEPVFKYIFRSEAPSHQQIRVFYELFLKASCPLSSVRVLRCEGKLAGAMIFYPPGKSISISKGIAASIPLILIGGPGALLRALKVGELGEKYYKEFFGEGYCELQFIGIGHNYRKRGLSTVLLEYLKELVHRDESCRGVVLEARDHLVDYYYRFGYRLKSRVDYFGRGMNFMYLEI